MGLDRNEGILALIHRLVPQITGRHGAADAIPFDTARFDAVVVQVGLMCFADRPAIREMIRVLRPAGG